MFETAFNRLSLSGLCATMIGNGIGRFSYIALMPVLIQAGWFSKSDASYLGVATLVGYVLGAAMSDALARRWSSVVLLRASMLVCSVSFFACAFEHAGLAWYYLWRTAAGAGGAVLMVLPAPLVLPQHGLAVRGKASGVVFSGIGLGAAVSGWLVPLLVSGLGVAVVVGAAAPDVFALRGAVGAWVGMGLLSSALTAVAWSHWPAEAAEKKPAAAEDAVPLPLEIRRTVVLILVAHGLNAIGYLTHTMFWVDYTVRELQLPLATGGFFWSLFGIGAAIGPMLTGALADSFGLRRCLIAGFSLKAFSAVLPVLSQSHAALMLSSVLMGICTPGIVALVSAFTLEQVGPAFHRKAWGMATSSFAIAQAAGGAAMAFAATRLSSYHPLFCASAAALVGSVACILLLREKAPARTPTAETVEAAPSPVETPATN